MFDVKQIRKDFPIFENQKKEKPFVYFDNAATAQKPQLVIDRIRDFYEKEYATVHRGIYSLSQEATLACHQVREKCRSFLNAKSADELIFVKGATEAINLVATSYGRKFLKKGDEILISEMEHHANFVPWQQLCFEKSLKLQIAKISDSGELDLKSFESLLTERTKLVAVTHMSNALGTLNPIKSIVQKAHQVGAVVLIDGAQGVVHDEVDLQAIDCDFYCFSGHKLYGPTGIGVLYGKMKHLEAMDPYQFGGDMIDVVSAEKTTFASPPLKFEAGTPASAQIMGLGAAVDYVRKIGMREIKSYEDSLIRYATAKISEIEGIQLFGTASEKGATLSFLMKGTHPHDVGTLLDQDNIAIRTGHHCAQPVMTRFNVSATARASFAFYNTKEEIDLFIESLKKIQSIFKI
jgi:cysteine desulfurase/selenocysteine lyase